MKKRFLSLFVFSFLMKTFLLGGISIDFSSNDFIDSINSILLREGEEADGGDIINPDDGGGDVEDGGDIVDPDNPDNPVDDGGDIVDPDDPVDPEDEIKAWTVLFFANANDISENSITGYIEKNLINMRKSGGTDANVNIVAEVYWPERYSYEDSTYFDSISPENLQNNRYEIGSSLITNVGTNYKMSDNFVGSLVSSMEWVLDSYPANRYMIVLAGGARGIYDPAEGEINWPTKSILFDDDAQNYMTNADLISALSQIKTLLEDERIDVLGFDASFMSGIENAHQVKYYARYLVGCESGNPFPGWDYENALAILHRDDSCATPAELAQNIVTTFKDYYYSNLAPSFQEFTQSAIDLSKIDAIKNNIDLVVSFIEEFRTLSCKEINDKFLCDSIEKSRRSAQEFQYDYYIDLYSFYVDLDEALSKHPKAQYGKVPPHTRSEDLTEGEKRIRELRDALKDGMQLIKDAIVMNVKGDFFPRATGLSCYFPWSEDRIGGDYENTEFANNCKWYDFLQYYVPRISK